MNITAVPSRSSAQAGRRVSRAALLPGVTLLGAALLSGCAIWKPVATPVTTGPGGKFTVAAPRHWMHFVDNGDSVTLTRDGVLLQFMDFAVLPPGEAFDGLNRPALARLTPEQLAEREVARLKALPALRQLEVIENKPATMAGRPGFRLHLRFRTLRGLRVDRVLYGANLGDTYLRASFQAPALHYFERDLPEFEKAVRSLTLRAGAHGS